MRTLDDLDVDGRRALVRVDFNVPLAKDAEGHPVVADDTRIRAALETIEELRSRGASIVLVSHLGRPEGRREEDLSMAPVVARLRELTDARVTLAPAVVGERVSELAEQLSAGELLVLENVRFEPGETRNDPALAQALAELADVYVNDAFGAAHRAHASTEGVAHLLPHAAGRLLPGRASVALPTDLVIGRELSAEAEHRVLDGGEVPEGWMGLDIGPASAERYAAQIAKTGSVFWNGPIGAFELEPFAAGTRRVGEAVAQAGAGVAS